MRKLGLIIIAVLSFVLTGNAQTTIITDDSTYTPTSANAIFEVHASNGNKGILIPRLTTAQRSAISTSAVNDISLLVYDTDFKSFWYYDDNDGEWVSIAASELGSGNQVLGMNAAGTANEYKTLNGTANRISINHGVGIFHLHRAFKHGFY